MTSLTLESIGKRFGGLEAVKDLTMTALPGQITGLIGPNGAGKTTVVNMITGMLSVTAGRIRLGARDITELPPQAIARTGISRTFQNIRLMREASVLDNVVVGYHRHELSSIAANLFGLPQARRERSEFTQGARSLISRFGMTTYAAVPAGTLSYGHQRRVEMMRALAAAPSFLLLDEPVAGMNDVEAEQLGGIFRQLAQDGLGILLIEHNMRFVMSMCETVCVLDAGRLISSGSPRQVSRDPLVIEAYLGG